MGHGQHDGFLSHSSSSQPLLRRNLQKGHLLPVVHSVLGSLLSLPNVRVYKMSKCEMDLLFKPFFIQSIVTASKSLVVCTVFRVLAFHPISILQSLLLLSPLQMNHIFFFSKRTILILEGSHSPGVGGAKDKTKTLFKYLGNINRPIFSWANSPSHRCERPCSC